MQFSFSALLARQARRFVSFALISAILPAAVAIVLAAQNPVSTVPPTASVSRTPVLSDSAISTGSASSATAGAPQQTRPGINIVVLDPAHGGTDPGARGTAGIRESDVVLELTWAVRQALEHQGFQVLQTRQGDQNPSFDDRSSLANAQLGAVFVSLHIGSTGLPGTVRVYVNSDLQATPDATGLIPWDRAQAPFLTLSHKLGDLVQAQLTLRFHGSPANAQTASIRQLRTTAAPAIAVEISSVTAEQRSDLDHMAAGVADAITQGVAAFRPSYVVPDVAGIAGSKP